MSTKRPFQNRLNDLTPKEWIKFQKSWFVHSPPRRVDQVKRHPAKFPETMAQEFIEFFTKKGQMVFDPMVGTGSTLLAALRSGRHSVGIELNPGYAEIANQLVSEERDQLGQPAKDLRVEVIVADAANLPEFDLPVIDYVLTSPPYWDMLHARGAQTQKQRRQEENLDVIYSDEPNDLGNEKDYATFVMRLASIYKSMSAILKPKAYLTIIVKNIKKGGRIYPLAWDLAQQLSEWYTLKDEKIWCQDDIRLAPYGMGNAWVSNTFHHYCLQFRYEPDSQA
jgi:DNA modification methylase